MIEFELSFDKAFKIPVVALKAISLYPSLVRERKSIILAIFLVINFFSWIFLFSYSLVQKAKAKDFSETFKNGHMIMLIVCVMLKYLITVCFQKNLAVLLGMINEDYELTNQMSTVEKNIVIDYAKKGRWLCEVWLVISIVSVMLFTVKPCVLMGFSCFQGHFEPALMVPITSPPFIQSLGATAEFFLTWCWQLMFGCLATVVYIGFEPSGPIFILHACGQLKLVEKYIMQFFAKLSDPRGMRQEKMAQCIKILQKVYRFINELNLIYTIHYEIIIKCSVVTIPFGCYIILTTWKDSPSVEFMTLVIGSFTQVYIPCYYSDLLMNMGENVRQALYACSWEGCPDITHRRTLLILMVRATRPPLIRSIFSIICLGAFADMTRQAFTLFNLMNVMLK